MDKQTLELAKQYTNPDYFGDKPMDQIAWWEHRDVMSYHFNLQLGDAEKALVDKIVSSLLSKTEFSWELTDLTIVGEAKVQGLLRDAGYDLKCFGLNAFPTSTADLTNNVEKHTIAEAIKVKLNNFRQNTLRKFLTFRLWIPYNIFFFYGLLAILSTMFAMWADPSKIIYAVVVAWIFCNCGAMLIHEWWTHDLIIPRNRIIGFVFDYLGHILFTTSRLKWRWDHRWHHRYWKTDKDLDYAFKGTPAWFYLFFATPIKILLGKETPAALSDEYKNGIQECYVKNMAIMTPESRFLERHWVKITVISHIILLAVLGYVNWTYFVLLQAWLFRCYIIGFNEIATHWPMKLTREEETNTPYLFPICCGTAYHVDHHSDSRKLVLGPGKLKYLNIQYWFIKVFFKPAPGAYYS